MKITSAMTLVALIIPLAAIQVILAQGNASWRHLLPTLSLWTLSATLLFLFFMYTLATGHPWILYLTYLFGFFWCSTSSALAWHLHRPSLGLFSVFLTLYWFLLCLGLRQDLNRTYFNPGMKWYQGLPQPIPGVQCQLTRGEKQMEVQVCRLDHEGAFIFAPHLRVQNLNSPQKAEFSFYFRNKQIQCQGTLIRQLRGGTGGGYYFSNLSPDAQKDLGDFVEVLRGEGYV